MKKNIFIIGLIIVTSCSSITNDTFNSRELISTTGEKIYINSLNWGMTNDYQLTVISKNKDRLKKRTDSLNTIKGIDPFIYSFNNDTLKLFFNKKKSYNVKDEFNSIKVVYSNLTREEFIGISEKANNNQLFYKVPMMKLDNKDSLLPKAPSDN